MLATCQVADLRIHIHMLFAHDLNRFHPKIETLPLEQPRNKRLRQELTRPTFSTQHAFIASVQLQISTTAYAIKGHIYIFPNAAWDMNYNGIWGRSRCHG